MDATRSRTNRTPDEDAVLAELYLEHAPRLTRWMTAYTRDPELAQDVVQEAFLRLAKELGAGRRPDNAPAWLALVARNLATSRARRNATAAPLREPPRAAVGAGTIPRRAALARSGPPPSTRRSTTCEPTIGRALRDGRRGASQCGDRRRIGRSELATRALLCRARRRLRPVLEPGDRASYDAERWVGLRRSSSSGARSSWRRLVTCSDAPGRRVRRAHRGRRGRRRPHPVRRRDRRRGDRDGFRVGAGSCVRMDAGAMPYAAIIAALRDLIRDDDPGTVAASLGRVTARGGPAAPRGREARHGGLADARAAWFDRTGGRACRRPRRRSADGRARRAWTRDPGPTPPCRPAPAVRGRRRVGRRPRRPTRRSCS